MPHVLIVNPTPKRKARKKRTSATRKHEGKAMARKTPKRGANGRFVKGSGASKRRSTKRRTYRRNPESRATRSRAAKRGWRRRHSSARRASPRRRSVRSYRRNPSGGKMVRTLKGALTPALVFPTAAIANDLVYNMLPLPAMLQSGLWKPAGKIGVAAVLGALSSFVLSPRLAQLVAGGMIGGVLLETGKDYLANTFPTLQLHGLADFPPMTYESGGTPYLEGADMIDARSHADGVSLGAYIDNSPTGVPSMSGMGAFVMGPSNEG